MRIWSKDAKSENACLPHWETPRGSDCFASPNFDLDHIRGLPAFLNERFSEPDGYWPDGREKRRYLIDQVITPLEPTSIRILHLLRKDAALCSLVEGDVSGETNKLLQVLCDMYEQQDAQRKSGKAQVPEFVCMHPRTELPFPQSMSSGQVGIGDWRCWCLGPRTNTSQGFTRQFEDYFGGNAMKGLPKVDANDVSRVFALTHEPSGHVVFLSGDSTSGEIEASMTEWKRSPPNVGSKLRRFGTVKVSHHGAATCHVDNLYLQLCANDSRLAVICAADDGAHPHEQVIKFFVDRKLSYRITGGRPKPLVSRESSRRGLGLIPGIPREIPPGADGSEDVTLQFLEGRASWLGGRESEHYHTGRQAH